MNFLEIQEEVIRFRFGTGLRESIKSWINARYASIWGGDDWGFTRVAPTTFAITAGDDTPSMPADFGNVLQIFDDQGTEVLFAAPWIFEKDHQSNLVGNVRARPCLYTVVNGQVILTPTPDINYTFRMSYLRGISVFNGAGVLTRGLLTNDDDSPVWPEEHHYLLVMGATSMGLKLENDFTWDGVEQEYQQLVEAMRDDLLPVDRAQTIQYGRDNL